MTAYDEGSRENFITVTQGISGWFAVMFWWNPEMDGFWEPYDTGIGRYENKDQAVAEGLAWSDEVELEFVMPE